MRAYEENNARVIKRFACLQNERLESFVEKYIKAEDLEAGRTAHVVGKTCTVIMT